MRVAASQGRGYILKRGTATPSGDFGITYGSEGMVRLDGFVGGPLGAGDGLYGSLAGFWTRSDNGVRDPQFAPEGGEQVTGTVAREWTDGSLLVYGRFLKYDAQFVTDTPLVNPAPGKFVPYSGISPLTGTLESRADQYEQLQVAPCTGTGCTPGSIPINLADGRGPNMVNVGGEYNYNFGGFQVLDDFSYSNGKESMVALYSTSSTAGGQNPEDLAAYIAYEETIDKLPKGLTASAHFTNTGALVPLTQNILTEELRYLSESFHSVSNEVHVSGEVFPGNVLTVGNYSALYGLTDLAYQGSDLLLQAQSNPAPISISLSNATNTWQLTSPEGFVNGPATAVLNHATAFTTAAFLSDSWKIGQWLFDGGARAEHEHFTDHFAKTAKGSLSGNTYELYNSSAQYLVPGSTPVGYSKTGVSWTVGLNYEIDPHMSVYVRLNDGVHLAAPSEVSISTPTTPVQKSHNTEIGYKFKNSFVYADLNAFYRTFSGIRASGLYAIDGSQETLSFLYGTRTTGLAYQIVLTPFQQLGGLAGGISLSATGDYSHGVYANSSGCVVATGLDNVPETVCNSSLDANGKDLARQPLFQTRVTPAYSVPTAWGSLRFWTTIEYIGRHFGDMYEQQYLGSYYDLSFGVTGEVGRHWQWTVRGTNMTNQIGLTEGNARDIGSSITANDVILARSMQGREVNAQLKYGF